MHPRTLACAALALVLAAPAAQAQPKTDPKGIEGFWLGTVKINGLDLRLAFAITKTDDGKLNGTLDSIDQRVKGIPVTEVAIKDGVARFDVKKIAGTFEGKLSKDGDELAGKWTQGGQTLDLVLKRVDRIPGLNRPQEPKGPFPYAEEEVVVENKKADVKLAGTLTKPKGDGPFPVVLLITGSGPQNRNEELLGHKPFLLIADYLTRRGVAVLRLDDRGVAKSTGNFATATTEDFAGDILAGVEYLKSRKDIDAKRIGLLGHSEGGMIAPMVAVKSPDVAFIVLLAGPGVPCEEILLRQGQDMLKAAGATKEQLAIQKAVQEAFLAIAKKEKDTAGIEKAVREHLTQVKAKGTDAEKHAAEALEKSIDAQVKALSSPWFRYFVTFDPQPFLRKVRCPVLAINGEKDMQVAATENLEAIAKALKEGGNKDATTKAFPNLNHLFQTCKTGALAEYSVIEETMAPAVLEAVAEWILQHVKKS